MRPPTAGSHYLHGSADWYKARLTEVSAKNDVLRVELDEVRTREARRCAFLRGMNRD